MTFKEMLARLPAQLKTRGAAAAAVAVLQLGILGGIVADRVRLLKTGREIVLPIQPVDPRDLFKGDYVRLGYAISTVPAKAVAGDILTGGKAVFVTIEPQTDGNWAVVQAATRYPKDVTAGQIVLRALPDRNRGWSNGPIGVRYGLERYFVPEGKGGDLEKLARDTKLSAIVAVDATGNAAIKGLSVDGKRIYEEPLF